MEAGADQPPLCGRLPGFFLLRVETPRSRLTFWPPLLRLTVKPSCGLPDTVRLRSASVTILLPIDFPRMNEVTGRPALSFIVGNALLQPGRCTRLEGRSTWVP